MNGTPIIPLDYETPGRRARRIRWRLCILVALGAFLVLMGLFLIARLKALRGIELNNRQQCALNLNQITQGIFLYARDNAGQYPDSLGTMLLNESISPDAFVCLSTNDSPSAKPTTREQATEIDSGKHCSYIYLGRVLTANQVTPDCVIVYEPLSNHGGDGMHVLFGDGHVEWIDKSHAASILKQVAAGKAVVRYPEGKPHE